MWSIAGVVSFEDDSQLAYEQSPVISNVLVLLEHRRRSVRNEGKRRDKLTRQKSRARGVRAQNEEQPLEHIGRAACHACEVSPSDIRVECSHGLQHLLHFNALVGVFPVLLIKMRNAP